MERSRGGGLEKIGRVKTRPILFILCLSGLLWGCGGPKPALQESASPALLPSSTPQVSSSNAPALEIRPGRLDVTSGQPVSPNEKVNLLQIRVGQGELMLGLRDSLAPKFNKALESLISKEAFKGRKVEYGEGLVVLKAHPQKTLATSSGEKNRVQPAPGQVYFDGKGTLAFTLDTSARVPPEWVCIGQIQVPPATVKGWRDSSPDFQEVGFFGHALQ